MPPTTRGTTWHAWATATASTPWGGGGERTAWDLPLAGSCLSPWEWAPQAHPSLPPRKENCPRATEHPGQQGTWGAPGVSESQQLTPDPDLTPKALESLERGQQGHGFSRPGPKLEPEARFLTQGHPASPWSSITKTVSSFRGPSKLTDPWLCEPLGKPTLPPSPLQTTSTLKGHRGHGPVAFSFTCDKLTPGPGG